MLVREVYAEQRKIPKKIISAEWSIPLEYQRDCKDSGQFPRELP